MVENMKIYRARAFTYPTKIEGREVIGNPASVVVCEKEFPSKEEMGGIAIDEQMPITVFVKKRENGEENEFDVRYFLQNGSQILICGHGSIVLSYILRKYFNYTKSNKFIYYYNTVNAIDVDFVHNQFFLQLPYFTTKEINIFDKEKYHCMHNVIRSLGIDENKVCSIHYCEKLKDYIIMVKNTEILRHIDPKNRFFVKYHDMLGCRGIFVISDTKRNDYSLEIRLFDSRLKYNEDIACGSVHCSLMSILRNKPDMLQANIKFNVLFPYNNTSDYFGGIQNIKYDYVNNYICVGSFASKF